MVLHKDYERFLKTMAHVKPTTLRNLRALLSRLPPPRGLTPKWLRGRMQEVSPQTVRNEKKAARRVLKWLSLPTNELDKVALPKVEGVTVKDLFTAKELELIFASAYETRDRAVIRVLYESAARASELLSMKIEDVRFNEDKTAHITVTGKTGVRELLLYRSVPSLKAWIEAHPTGEGSVWVTLKGELSTLSYTGLFQVVKKIISRAGLKKRKTCHMFRHSRLTELVKLGIRGEHLRKFAGWRPGSMMESVYIHLSQVDVERELWSKAYGLEDNGTFEPMMTLRECPHCKENNDALARVCMSCGRRMNESTSELETMKDRLTNLENLIRQVALGKVPANEWLLTEVYEEPSLAKQEQVHKETLAAIASSPEMTAQLEREADEIEEAKRRQKKEAR